MATAPQLPVIVMKGLEHYPPVEHGSLHALLAPHVSTLIAVWAVCAGCTIAYLFWRGGFVKRMAHNG